MGLFTTRKYDARSMIHFYVIVVLLSFIRPTAQLLLLLLQLASSESSRPFFTVLFHNHEKRKVGNNVVVPRHDRYGFFVCHKTSGITAQWAVVKIGSTQELQSDDN